MASFSDVLRLQTKGLEQLDSQTLRRLQPLLKQSVTDLRDQLDKFSTESYSYKQRTQSLRSVQNALHYIENSLEKGIEEAAYSYNYFAQKISQKEIKQLGLVTPQIDQDLVSMEKNEFLINNAKESLRIYNSDIRSRVSEALTQGVLQKRTGFEVTGRLSKFMKIKTYRVERIVRTELHKIFNSSKMLAYSQFKNENFPDMKKALYHPMDHRTGDDSKQLAKLGPIVDIDKPFVFVYKRTLKSGAVRKDKRVFMVPPDRPNDRAAMVPYRPEWDEKINA